mgnify:FL=1
MDFIAIDFETANRYPNSACSLGIVYVDNQTIKDEKYFLIRPPIMNFDPNHIRVHGLTADDVTHAPSFKDVWEIIKADFTDTMIIAHNAYFDMSVLKACLKEYQIPVPDMSYCCSIPISNRAIKGERVKQSLKERTNFFGIQIEEHHHALADARACAELVLKSMEATGQHSFTEFQHAHPTLPVKRLSELKPMNSFSKEKKTAGKKFSQSIKIGDVTPTKEVDESNLLYGKTFVFTGDLDSMERIDAMQLVVNFGGILKSSVSKKTDYLIIGTQDQALVSGKGISSKEIKARELQENGSPIKMLDETHFLRLLSEAKQSSSIKQ